MKKSDVTEELVYKIFLAFVIFVVDSFAKLENIR